MSLAQELKKNRWFDESWTSPSPSSTARGVSVCSGSVRCPRSHLYPLRDPLRCRFPFALRLSDLFATGPCGVNCDRPICRSSNSRPICKGLSRFPEKSRSIPDQPILSCRLRLDETRGEPSLPVSAAFDEGTRDRIKLLSQRGGRTRTAVRCDAFLSNRSEPRVQNHPQQSSLQAGLR